MFNTNPSRQALSDNQLRVLPLTAGEPKIGDASFRQPLLTAKRKVVVPMNLKTSGTRHHLECAGSRNLLP